MFVDMYIVVPGQFQLLGVLFFFLYINPADNNTQCVCAYAKKYEKKRPFRGTARAFVIFTVPFSAVKRDVLDFDGFSVSGCFKI